MNDRLPPGPRDWLFGIPQVQRMKADILGYYLDLQRSYGDIVCVLPGPYRYYVLFDPEAIREVLTTKAKSFERKPSVRRVLSQWNGDSVLIAEGEEWRQKRRLVQPAFHPRRFAAYADTIVEFASQFVDGLAAEIRSLPAAVIDVEAAPAMTRLTLGVITKTLFGVDVSTEAESIGRAVAILSDTAVREMQSEVHLPDWLPLARKRDKRWAIATLKRVVGRIVHDRRASGRDEGDLLSMLLLAVDQEGNGSRMSDQQACDEAMTLLLAGHDTSAAGLIWTWYCLANNPAAAARAVEEIDGALGGRRASAADLPRLPYTEAVVKESLRLYPPAVGVFMRQAMEDVEIGGYHVRRGSLVQPISFVTHRDPRWFPDPMRFEPERFLNGRDDAIPQFAYFPFGGGPRACVGAHFAMMEMTLVVATVLQSMSVELASGQGEPALDAKMSLRPRGGLRLRFRERAAIGARFPSGDEGA